LAFWLIFHKGKIECSKKDIWVAPMETEDRKGMKREREIEIGPSTPLPGTPFVKSAAPPLSSSSS
jgi:hypothetical protein